MVLSLALDLLYLVLGALASPVVLVKALRTERWRAGWRERFGGAPFREGDRPCVWVHAVSVGETNAARPFIELLQRERPDWDIRVSTTTNTGQAVARTHFGAARCFYFPLDLSWAVRRAFRRVRPTVIVLVELELWPNFIRAARRRGVPIVVINGRMRERSVGRYRLLRPLFRPAFDPRGPNRFCVQNETYRERFHRAGVPDALLEVTGNVKYDAVGDPPPPERADALRAAFGLGKGDRLWVGACTWPGEEAICLDVHRRLLETLPGLRLVLAPRHVERAAEAAQAIAAAGFACRKRTDGGGPTGPETVGLLDTLGELGYLYGSAEAAFVGKSLAVGGGHNLLEPAAFGAPPLFGPLTENFEAEARLLLDAEAAFRVADADDLYRTLRRLLEDPTRCRACAERGRAAVFAHRGASRRTLDVVQRVAHGPSA